MPQAALPYKDEQPRLGAGMRAMAPLPVHLDSAQAMRLWWGWVNMAA